MKKTIFCLKNLILIILVISMFSTAYASVGKIAALRGKAVSINNGNSRELSVKSEIYLNDRIETGKNSRLQILFYDETIAGMGPESTLIVKDFKWNDREQKFEAEAKEGLFHIMGGKIVNTAPQNFKIDTPVASIGIRGSMFAFRVAPKNISVVFLGGKGIDIKTPFGSTALVKPGFGTRISEDEKRIEPPRQFSEEEISEFRESDDSPPGPAPQDPDQGQGDGDSLSSGIDNIPGDDSPPVSDPEDTVFADIISSKNQDQIGEQVTDEGESKTAAFVSGGFTGSGFDDYNIKNPDSFTYPGSTTGEFSDFLKITEKSSSGSIISYNEFSNFSWPDLNAAYSAPQLNPDSPHYDFDINILSSTYTVKADIVTSPLHQFYLVHVPPSHILASNPDYAYTSTSYFGVEADSSNYPFDKIFKYSGHFTASAVSVFNSEDYVESISGGFTLGANFKNKRIFGVFNENKSQHDFDTGLMIFGTISDDNKTIGDIVVIGSKIADHEQYIYPEGFPMLSSVYSNQASGSFFGSVYQGIGITGTGTLNDAGTMTETGKSYITMGGFRNQTPAVFSDSGIGSMKGFVIGIAENLEFPETGRKFFMNSEAGQFSIVFNMLNGTVSGALTAYDNSTAANEHSISDLAFGGNALNSVYIDDNVFAAVFDSDSQKISSYPSGKTSPVNRNTGFLFSGNIFEDQNEYLTWGYWEASYNDPDNSSTTYHIHAPGSFFIAGQPTPDITSVLQELSQTNTVLNYSGVANTAVIDSFSQMGILENGTFNMSVSLDTYDINASIKPDINNAALILNYTGTVGSTGFSANINPDISSYGSLNGTFFGPKAEAAGGNFDAEINANRYIGIFSGKR
ncbi:MAG: FecR domain-containing protein [Desulfobacteraceae bacterium]